MSWIFFTGVAAAIILSRLYSYLLFHTAVEIFSMVIAFSIFLFAWNTRRINKNHYFLFLGIAFLSIGVLDFFHTLSYRGMNIFAGFGPNAPTQLWIAQRYLLAIAFFSAPFFIHRKIKELLLLIGSCIISALLLLSVFYWQNFPDSFIEGRGLTQFEVSSEYIISFIFLISAFMLYRLRRFFDKKVFYFLISSVVLNIFTELFFTLYTGVYDYFNMAGNITQLIAFFLMYKTVIEVGLKKPYNLLFLELNKANERKDEFISIASHELKSPLTTIKGYVSLLQNKLPGRGPQRKYVKQIDEQADRINRMVGDLLNVSRIEAGKFVLNQDVFKLDEIVKKTVQNASRFISTHRIIFEGRTGVSVKGDSDKISQVIFNLLNNAVRHSPEGSQINVRADREDRKVIVSVRDFGTGIPKKKLPFLFDKFYQANPDQKSEGLGLGLYIAKEIIKLHKGKITAQSSGKGSTFSFTLPVT